MKSGRKFMFSIFTAVILALMSAFYVMAQEKTNKTDNIVVKTKPANGSLFMEDARNVDLVNDYKPRRVGDIIFVDVVESSSASVTSNAKHTRESGSLGGVLVGAAPLPTTIAGAAAGIAGALGSRKFEG